MTRKPKHAWMVRAGDQNILADQVEAKNAVAIGWSELGDLGDLKTREQFKKRYREVNPDQSVSRVGVNAGQLYRFCREISSGDYVLTYDKSSRELIIGIACQEYRFDPTIFGEEYPQIRRADWLGRVSRDQFTLPARNSMGSTLTVFLLDEHLDEIHAAVSGSPPAEVENGDIVEPAPPFYDEVKAQADELIADKVSALDPYDIQDLAADLLRAMGYRSVSSPPGRDRGIDIVAHPDFFGFEGPRIKAQVKHTKGKIGGPDVRAFIGALRAGDNGLYISTGGYTADAQIEAERSREPVTLLDRDQFIQLLLENYETLDPEFKAMIPLRRVWLPTE